MIPPASTHNAMKYMRSGGLDRTRTWDQEIMSPRITLFMSQKAEES